MNKRFFTTVSSSEPLLPQHSEFTWIKKLKGTVSKRKPLLCSNAILLLLLWQFSTGLTYNLLLQPLAYLQNSTPRNSAVLACLIALLFLLFSPFAGFVADVKCGRFKILVCSTYLMVVSNGLILLLLILLIFTVHSFNYYVFIIVISLLATLLIYIVGRVFFLANSIQFGTDQLRDAPTRYSVLFLYAYYWCDNFCTLNALTTNIPGHEIKIILEKKILLFDSLKTALYILIMITSILLSTMVLLIVFKKKHLFMTENIGRNPYRLVYGVVKFAIQHKQPIRRSAFTYCDNECPSRLDFAKQRYGGPFTTEQVEDVKVLFNILKVLFCLCPVFFLDLSAQASAVHHYTHNSMITNTSNHLYLFFISYGILSPLLTALYIPVCLLLAKAWISRYFPNIFKRMGLGIALLTLLFGLYFVYTVITNNTLDDSQKNSLLCSKNLSFLRSNRDFIVIYNTPLLISENILSSICHTFLYVASWEFICCQSPQHMKGLLFGIFYAMQAFYNFLAASTKLIILYTWELESLSCQSGYFLFNFTCGLISLIIFVIVTRRYKYRKRDDICNVYQYAEDYYSNIQ